MENIALRLQSNWLLLEIVEQQGSHVAKFAWQNTGNKSQSSEIILQCHLSAKHLVYLNKYQPKLTLDYHVKVIMSVNLLDICNLYHGQTPACPDKILTLEAVIENIQMVQVKVANKALRLVKDLNSNLAM
jgi:hypothetical protein